MLVDLREGIRQDAPSPTSTPLTLILPCNFTYTHPNTLHLPLMSSAEQLVSLGHSLPVLRFLTLATWHFQEVDRHNWEKFYAIVLYVIQFRRLETATPDTSFDWLKEISLAR